MSLAAAARIYVAGHSGFVGSALVRRLRGAPSALCLRSRAELDLMDQSQVERFMSAERPGVVFVAAAQVGGIAANASRPAEFLYNNLAIEANLIHASWRAGVEVLLFLGSSCMYPVGAAIPIREEALLAGPLETTNAPYAIAKIAGLGLCATYSRQYGCDFRALVPTNLFGLGDHYDLATSHVLPALIRKCHLARLAEMGDEAGIWRDVQVFGPIPESTRLALGIREVEGRLTVSGDPVRVEVWGSGRPRREFLWVDDLAEACVLIAGLTRDAYERACDGVSFMNVGSGEERTIAEIAEVVREVVGTRAPISFDASKLDGAPRKLVDSRRMRSLGWKPRVGFEEGVLMAYRDYLARQSAFGLEPVRPL